jgi:hypothetical protein
MKPADFYLASERHRAHAFIDRVIGLNRSEDYYAWIDEHERYVHGDSIGPLLPREFEPPLPR